jgi:hypothetical protein
LIHRGFCEKTRVHAFRKILQSEEPAMSNPVRARGHEWQIIDKVFCLTVHAEDKKTSIAIPIGALLTLAADGRRRQMALHNRTMSAADAASPEPALLKHESMLPVQSYSVGTSDNGMLALILDRGLDTEMLLGLTPDVAETLAGLFTKLTGGAPQTPAPPE